MANEDQLALLKAGVEGWNEWREKEPDEEIDLSGADLSQAKLRGAKLNDAILSGADLSKVDLREADLREAFLLQTNLCDANLSRADLTRANLLGADLRRTNLRLANFTQADLTGAQLYRAYLKEANCTGANFTGAILSRGDFTEANFTGCDFTGADLTNSSFIGTKIDNAKISKCNIYGVSVWGLAGEFKDQKELMITPEGESVVTVDNINVAQFIYLILNNKEVRDVINTLTSKTVLILGRFAIPERKVILDKLRDKLREYNLLPIVFDFERPVDKDFTETIKTLAGLSYFVIADVTNPKSSPLELQATVPDYQIPFVPIIQEGEEPFAMMVDLHKKYNWVLEPRSYDSVDTLLKALKPGIIDPAIKMHYELRLIKAKEQTIHPLRDFLDKS
jgi:uncharacterized protein YjbI with pentapeptide repeats